MNSLGTHPRSAILESDDLGGFEIPTGPLTRTRIAIEVVLTLIEMNGTEPSTTTLWSTLKVRPASFDISGGWTASEHHGKQSMAFEPYLKTLKRMHINTGQIEEVAGYTDRQDLYSRYPIKRFNRLADRQRYDVSALLPSIHAVEFLGEPQYGGGRPVPPQEVFDQLEPYDPWQLPTSLTLSEERTWRYYAGLSDYPHFDAYRVIAPAANAWSRYNRWDGKTIRWGSPLETIGDMTRSLREQSRPASIAAWSQGPHDGWGGILSPRRASPNAEELRSQAWHALGNGIASLYWFNLSIRSLCRYPDLIQPVTDIGREVAMLRGSLERGTAYDYERKMDGSTPDWDLSSIATPETLLMVANDLKYTIDESTKTFQFPVRDGEFAFRCPPWLQSSELAGPLHVFRIDAQGTHQVPFQWDGKRLAIQDSGIHVVGLYIATSDALLQQRMEEQCRACIAMEGALGFDPAQSPDDFQVLQEFVDGEP